MSVNGAASGKHSKINFCDFDGLKKKELERRKKLRLEQVCWYSILWLAFHMHNRSVTPLPYVLSFFLLSFTIETYRTHLCVVEPYITPWSIVCDWGCIKLKPFESDRSENGSIFVVLTEMTKFPDTCFATDFYFFYKNK